MISEKSKTTLAARAALLGYQMHIAVDDDGFIRLTMYRHDGTINFPTIEELESFLVQHEEAV